MAAHGNRRIAPFAVLAVAIVVAIGWWAWSTWGTTDDARAKLTGTVEADEMRVASVIAGRIVSATATEGAPVKQGDELFRLDAAILAQQVKQAEAGVRAAKARLDQSKKDDESDADIAAAQARLDQARAALTMAKLQVEYATVVAPADGVITAVAARTGEIAAPGKALATLSDPRTLRVSVFVAETDIGRVKIGDSATVSSDGGGTWDGRVTFIASESEFTPNNVETRDQRVKLVYEVRVVIESDDDHEALKPGMPVTVELESVR